MSTIARTELWVWFYLTLLALILIVLAPASRFIQYGWRIRKEEFTNKLAGKSIDIYLTRFWAETLSRRPLPTPGARFSYVYDTISGRRLYVTPLLLLTAALIGFGGLALMAGMKAGYLTYVGAAESYRTASHAGAAAAGAYLRQIDLDLAFWPFPPLGLTLSGVAAVAGAYLWTVQTVFRGYLSRTLLSTDLLWAAFRIVIAIPLGLSVGLIGSPALAPLVAFALGAFPIGEINKLLRRLGARALNEAERDDDADQMLKMSGVTADVSAQLADAKIYSPQQLIDTDPLSLTLRTGLPFDFVVNLISQSQVWSWLGAAAADLIPTGYGDARMIRRLMTGLAAAPAPAPGAPPTPDPIAAMAVVLNTDPALLRPVLQAIADDPYTGFLAAIST